MWAAWGKECPTIEGKCFASRVLGLAARGGSRVRLAESRLAAQANREGSEGGRGRPLGERSETIVMVRVKELLNIPPRTLGFGLWWMWIYLTMLSPTFASSSLTVQPISGPGLSFLTIVSGAVVFAVAIPLTRRFPQLLGRRAVVIGAGALAALATFAMGFSGLFGSAASAVFVGASALSGVGISLLYLQWGTCYAQLRPSQVAPCTVVSFLLAIVGASLALDRGVVTLIVAVALPLACALLVPSPTAAVEGEAADGAAAGPVDRGVGLRGSGGWATAGAGGAAPEARAAAGRWVPVRFPGSVVALILVFSFAFGLFRVLLSPHEPTAGALGLLFVCSAALALVMLGVMLVFSVSLGWDSVVYLALPLIAGAALVLSVVDFADRAFVWAIIVAAVRCADLVMWIIFAKISCASRESAVAVFAFGKLMAQMGVLAGMLVAERLATAFDVEALLLPTALAFLMLVTLLGSLAALRGQMTGRLRDGRDGGGESVADGTERGAAEDALVAAIAAEKGLSPRETEIFALLAKGRTVPRIAEELVLANSTVTTHVRSIYRKLDIHNRQELLDYVESRPLSHE